MRYAFLTLLISLQFGLFAQNGMYDICPIKNSEVIPEVTVYNLEGEAIKLNEYIGARKAVLVFYRGGWCPYCMKHLSALQEVKSNIDEKGYELIALTPDDFSNLDSSRTKAKFDYTLFSDKAVNAINAFGIAWQVDEKMFAKYKDQYGIDLEFWSANDHHTLPVPSVFIVEEGKIQYQHVDPNYSQRLSADILLSFLK